MIYIAELIITAVLLLFFTVTAAALMTVGLVIIVFGQVIRWLEKFDQAP